MPATATTLVHTISHGTASGNYDGSSVQFFSDKVKADGYYGYTDGFHTVAYFPSSFVGIINIQGTLALNPTEDDWFDIDGTTLGDGSTEQSTNTTYNFSGNFVWIRAKVDLFTGGTIDKIQYNY